MENRRIKGEQPVVKKSVERLCYGPKWFTDPVGRIEKCGSCPFEWWNDTHGEASDQQGQGVKNAGEVYGKYGGNQQKHQEDLPGPVERTSWRWCPNFAVPAHNIQTSPHGTYPSAEKPAKEESGRQQDHQGPEKGQHFPGSDHGAYRSEWINAEESVNGEWDNILSQVSCVQEKKEEEDTEHPLGDDPVSSQTDPPTSLARAKSISPRPDA